MFSAELQYSEPIFSIVRICNIGPASLHLRPHLPAALTPEPELKAANCTFTGQLFIDRFWGRYKM